MKVMTYNVLAQAYCKPERYPHTPASAFDATTRRALLFERIDSLDADVMLLQEIEPDLHEVMQACYPSSEWASHYMQRPGHIDGCAVWVRRSVGDISLSDELVFASHEPGYSQVAAWMMLITPAGTHIGVMSTHLRWQPREKADSEHVGLAQLEEALNVSDAHDCAWIVGGDFNALSQSCVLKHAFGRGWSLGGRAQRPWDTVNFSGKRRKIDYLLYKRKDFMVSPGRLIKLESDTPMPSVTEPSDHLPVVVDFELLQRNA